MPADIITVVPTFKKILHTNDFSEWESIIAHRLGTHRSHLRSGSAAFHACCHAAHVGPLQILHLQGKGELELDRTQMGGGLLWIPLKGISEERINGRVVQASRGQAILMRPLDHLYGLTSAEMTGLSVILPDNFFAEIENKSNPDALSKSRCSPEPLLASHDASDHAVNQFVMQLSRAVAHRDPCSAILACQLLDRLEHIIITASSSKPSRRQSLGARRRWKVVQEATEWMRDHLTEPFRIGDVAAALETPTRTIQMAFAEELGRSPLAQTKLLRLHALRRKLQDPQQKNLRIATQMTACGLPASGETAQAYRSYFGERPSQTKSFKP
jgi:AraC-like DNA-binding protein